MISNNPEHGVKGVGLVAGDAIARRRRDAAISQSIILDAAERLMRGKGYAAVTTRRVAAEAGVKPPLVHYHFTTTDNLLLALYRRSAEQTRARLFVALESDHPLQALWALNADPERMALAAEFMALANHRDSIRVEMARNVTMFRAIQADALQRMFDRFPEKSNRPPPEVAAMVIAAIGRALAMEHSIGISAGHDATRRFVEWSIAALERP
jgi:AcrR family transcriptional regulator